MSDSGTASTQIQKLNSIAREVNRRLGLTDDSIVGKSIAASASVGGHIPLLIVSLPSGGPQVKADADPHYDQIRETNRQHPDYDTDNWTPHPSTE